MRERRRTSTSTSNFGVTGRETHDATGFYQRFRAPILSEDRTVLPPQPVAEPFLHGDARRMDAVADGSVALVVTSPPYFAGKQYEEELERDGVPSSYLEYLELLTNVFAECRRTLEPGGRIAVNVANLGRKPYRSLSSDVIRILEHDLGFLLRGELIWQKGVGATGSCAWGSFRSAANPVLRDLTERVIVASKGRFDRARSVKERAAAGLPHQSTLMTDDFTTLTLDVWSIPAESARRVGHPAPFPVELPEQLIRLYTFAGDLVLDPFMGSGSTLVAAAALDRRYVGYDLDAGYVELARRRVGALSAAQPAAQPEGDRAPPAGTAVKVAGDAVVAAGFTVTGRNRRIPGTGVTVSLVAEDGDGQQWYFDVAGPHTTHRGGLLRHDTVWRALGRAAAIRGGDGPVPLVLLTTALPPRGDDGDQALRAAGPGIFFDAIVLGSDDGQDRLERYAKGGFTTSPQPGFWSGEELDRLGRNAEGGFTTSILTSAAINYNAAEDRARAEQRHSEYEARHPEAKSHREAAEQAVVRLQLGEPRRLGASAHHVSRDRGDQFGWGGAAARIEDGTKNHGGWDGRAGVDQQPEPIERELS